MGDLHFPHIIHILQVRVVLRCLCPGFRAGRKCPVPVPGKSYWAKAWQLFGVAYEKHGPNKTGLCVGECQHPIVRN